MFLLQLLACAARESSMTAEKADYGSAAECPAVYHVTQESNFESNDEIDCYYEGGDEYFDTDSSGKISNSWLVGHSYNGTSETITVELRVSKNSSLEGSAEVYCETDHAEIDFDFENCGG
ncbi:MAG: hypothetical protein H7A33_02950 [Deltaproteobacteria bacterium]|nr:hypothetical protein [Deltaproteobacteria bacterium]